MTQQEEIDALEKQIAGLHLRVGSATIREHLFKQLQFLRTATVVSDSGIKESIPDNLPAKAGRNQIDVADIKGTLLRVDGKVIFLPESLDKETEQIFNRIKDASLKEELKKDYYYMYVYQNLENVIEGARLAHKQIENIINCCLSKKNTLNIIKKSPAMQKIWHIQFVGGQGKKHPAEIAYGDLSKRPDMKWPEEENMPDDGKVSFVNKAILYFAYCSNTCDELKEGLRNGMIDRRLFSELTEIKNLRDVASHGFALRRNRENSLLKCSCAEAFSKMRSTLQIFRNTMPDWL